MAFVIPYQLGWNRYRWKMSLCLVLVAWVPNLQYPCNIKITRESLFYFDFEGLNHNTKLFAMNYDILPVVYCG